MIVELVDPKKLRIPIEKDQPVCCRSQAKQDLFVVAMTHGMRHGTWLEIGCYLPDFINNTFMLEKDFAWSGYSVDINTDLETAWTESRPNAKFIGSDALNLDWDSMPCFFDYVQIDIDPVQNNLTMLSIVLEQVSFKCLTFEHDFFSGTLESAQARNESRNMLQSAGYQLIANDVTILPNDGRPANLNPMWFEDWWVNPALIDQHTINTYKNVSEHLESKYWHHILL